MNKQIEAVFDELADSLSEDARPTDDLSHTLAGALMAVHVVSELIERGILAKGPAWEKEG